MTIFSHAVPSDSIIVMPQTVRCPKCDGPAAPWHSTRFENRGSTGGSIVCRLRWLCTACACFWGLEDVLKQFAIIKEVGQC